MKYYMLLFLLVVYQNCKSMKSKDQTNEEFCEALSQNNRETLNIITTKYLSTLKVTENPQKNFKSIEQWIKSYDCVESVEIISGMLRSDPPIKVFEISLKNSLHSSNIGIQVFPDRLAFNNK